MTSEDTPYTPLAHQDTYCPKCGAGFPTLQKLDVYNNEEYLGEFYRFYCNACEYATLLYDDPMELREAWEKEHEKNLPNHLYNKYVNQIISVLKKQEGYYYANALLELGAQVVEGESIYWSLYSSLIEDLATSKVSDLPYNEQKLLYENISLSTLLNFDKDTPMLDVIVREIFNKVCSVAEEAYYEYQEE